MDLLEALDKVQALAAAPATAETEADTRTRLIDPLLEALGWPPSSIRREPYAGWADNKGFVDYLLQTQGRPRFVVEAKKRGRAFDIPAALQRQKYTSYKKLYTTGSPDLTEALEQCLRYTQHTGALYAAVTNGVDWLFFKPNHAYRALPDARVIVFSGLDSIRGRLDEFEQLLSVDGVETGRCEAILLGREVRSPSFAKRLRDLYPYYQPTSTEEEDYNQVLLELIDPLLRTRLIDIPNDEILRECYVPVNGNFNTASTIAAAIASRAKAATSRGDLFVDSLVRPPLIENKTGRTLILHGQMGVGKTTFLRNCERELKETGALSEIVWARVDLLPFHDRTFQAKEIQGLLALISKSLQHALAAATERLDGHYDPHEWSHLRAIYNTEARNFQKSKFPDSDDSDQVYMGALRSYVWDLSQADTQEHLLRTIRWFTSNKLPVVLVLDNSDQLGLQFQEYLHKLAQSIQANTTAVTILVLRTEALASHRIREHAIASVDEYFQIMPAPLPTVLKRRFEQVHELFAALGSSEGALAVRDMRTVAMERLSTLMDTIESEAARGTEAFQIINAVGNGSLRDALRAVAALFRSSPKAMDRMVVAESRHGVAQLDSERVIRALMKEDLRGLDSYKLLPNVFITEDQVYVPYSLAFRMLQQVRGRNSTGDYTLASLLNDFAIAGIDRALCDRTARRLRKERMLSVTHLSDMREDDVLTTTPLGEAMSDVLLRFGGYYSRMSFETYIYDSATFYLIRDAWNSSDPFFVKLGTMGKYFSYAIEDADSGMRQSLDLAQLDPIIDTPLPLPHDWKRFGGTPPPAA